jgi:transglutaminase-like putative cysteine protease
MLIRAGYEMIFQYPTATPMSLLLRIHPSREADIRFQEVRIEPSVSVDAFVDSFGNRCERLVAPPGRIRLWGDAIVEDDGQPDPFFPYARQAPVEGLPREVLPFLMSSRYCEVDQLSDTAWKLFGATPPGWARVQAICDWVHAEVRFGYGFARNTKSALDTFRERQGVCRDFTHLAVTFCRCLNIPARYVSGYLGDIGVSPLPDPMDLSAWFEVYLDGQWHTFDARHNQRRIGRILMSVGRDATDTAYTTAYGQGLLVGFKIWTDEISQKAAAQLGAVPPAGSNGTHAPEYTKHAVVVGMNEHSALRRR